MAEPIRLRKRSRLKHKEARELSDAMVAALGASPFGEEDPVESAEAEGRELFVVNNEPLALRHNGAPFPTVRGLLKMKGDLRRWVTVDMGAVKFVTNGADVMCPGIVECDPDIRPGDMVWIRDERNKRPLAVGEALLAGPEILAQARAKAKGKAIKSVHYVGDKFWSLSPQAGEGGRGPAGAGGVLDSARPAEASLPPGTEGSRGRAEPAVPPEETERGRSAPPEQDASE